MSASSIASHVSALSYAHKINNHPDPTKAFAILQLLKSIRKKRPSVDKRKPITIKILQAICNSLHKMNISNYEIKLFTSMFVMAFHFGLRVSEITHSPHNINFNQITISASSIRLRFNTFKHSEAEPFLHALSASDDVLCPVKVLNSYLSMRGKTEGALFLNTGLPISSRNFNAKLKQALILSRICPEQYSCHSFRIGAASLWATIGKSDVEIRRLGRWKSSANKTYLRCDVDHTL